MSRTLSISDTLYQKLEAEACKQGLASIEQLLEERHVPARSLTEDELHQRRETVERTIALQERLSRTYGEMPDSIPLIREDRER